METKVPTTDLRVGMFVTDLDRPWVDTPFLLQGFLIEDDEQIRDLQQHCMWVVVDRARSTGDEYEAPPTANVAAPGRQSAQQQAQVVKAGKPADAAPQPKPATPSRPAPTSGARVINLEDVLTRRGSSSAGGAIAPPPGAPVDDEEGLLGRVFGRFKGMLKRGDARPRPRRLRCRSAQPEETPAGIRRARRAAAARHHGPDLSRPGARRGGGACRRARSSRAPTSVLDKLVTDIRVGQMLEVERSRKSSTTWSRASCAIPTRSCGSRGFASRTSPPTATACRSRCTSPRSAASSAFPSRSSRCSARSGLLLDIGKIRLPRELLEKQGRLTAEEFEAAKPHVQYGLDILARDAQLPSRGARGHRAAPRAHERQRLSRTGCVGDGHQPLRAHGRHRRLLRRAHQAPPLRRRPCRRTRRCAASPAGRATSSRKRWCSSSSRRWASSPWAR